MISVDTNVLVRLLTNDDPIQAQRAARIMEKENVFVPKTVLLETEWVLRHAYKIERPNTLQAFHKLLGLPNVSVENPETVSRALLLYAEGLDFADALHLASSKDADGFATFDKNLLKKADRISSVRLIQP
jgi:predicted nucleic-acid-binding protein